MHKMERGLTAVAGPIDPAKESPEERAARALRELTERERSAAGLRPCGGYMIGGGTFGGFMLGSGS
jgi:hypothetical protein